MFGKKKSDRQVDQVMYAIYDQVAECYSDLSYASNDQDLCRQLVNMFRDPRQSQNRYLLNAEDFTVYRVGNYNYQSGTVQAEDHKRVCNLVELRSAAERLQRESDVRNKIADVRVAMEKHAETQNGTGH